VSSVSVLLLLLLLYYTPLYIVVLVHTMMIMYLRILKRRFILTNVCSVASGGSNTRQPGHVRLGPGRVFLLGENNRVKG